MLTGHGIARYSESSRSWYPCQGRRRRQKHQLLSHERLETEIPRWQRRVGSSPTARSTSRRNRVRDGNQPMSDLEQITIAPGLTFNTLTAGKPDAPLVLLLPAFAESVHCWRAQVAALAAAGRRAG